LHKFEAKKHLQHIELDGCSVSGDSLQYRLEQSVYHRRTQHVIQLFTYLVMPKLFSSCIRRYLVSRSCDWVTAALSAMLLTFSFQFSLLFFNISLTRPHQHRSVLLVLIRNIGDQTLPKIWISTFEVHSV